MADRKLIYVNEEYIDDFADTDSFVLTGDADVGYTLYVDDAAIWSYGTAPDETRELLGFSFTQGARQPITGLEVGCDMTVGDVATLMQTSDDEIPLYTVFAIPQKTVSLENLYEFKDKMDAAAQTALDAKQATLVSGTNIKTVNGQSVLGSGDLSIDCDVMTSITYSELKALRDNAQLIPGMQYRITDYQCTTSTVNTSSAGHQFDIIVVADSANTLNETARACLHTGDTYFSYTKFEAWQLKYCLDNDTNRFGWADTTNGKGVIYWLRDENGNECQYDFKNIIFDMYEHFDLRGPGTYTYYRNATLDANGYYGWTTPSIPASSYNMPKNVYTNTLTLTSDMTWYKDTSGTVGTSFYIRNIRGVRFSGYTFNCSSSSTPSDVSMQGGVSAFNCIGNVILGRRIDTNALQLNFTVFTTDSQHYIKKANWYRNTIGFDNHDNVFNSVRVNNNEIAKNFNDNVFNYYAEDNHILGEFYSNVCDYEFQNNRIDGSFYSNAISSRFGGNTIRHFYQNDVGSMTSCEIGILSNSSIGRIGSCRIEDASYITLGNGISGLTIGQDCSYISIGDSVNDLYLRDCEIESNVHYIVLTCLDTVANYNNYLQNVRIHTGVHGSSSSNMLTIEVPDRNLQYSIDYYATGSQEVYL